VGGFLDIPVIDTIRNILLQGGFPLRGYPVVAMAGRSYGLFNAEYRFPIVEVDRGLSTLPVFLSRVTGAVFADYGTAFDDASKAKFKLGTGGELWFETQIGYFLYFTFRAGYARGLMSGGIDRFYFVAAVPF
jgi:outer membrane protein assembly factor BamA